MRTGVTLRGQQARPRLRRKLQLRRRLSLSQRSLARDHPIAKSCERRESPCRALDQNAAAVALIRHPRRETKTLKRINALIKDCLRHPFEGIGKPEPLKENLSGFWSRRIDDTHRLVYCVDDQALVVIACRFHYQ